MGPGSRARLLSAAALFIFMSGGAALAAPARHAPAPDPRDQRIKALEDQVGELTRMVREMHDRQAATATPQAATAAPVRQADAAVPATSPDQPRPVVASAPGPSAGAHAGGASILAGKPSIQSPDGRFAANLHGVLQVDAAGYFQKAAGPVATDLRRGAGAGDTAHARDLNNGTNFRRARIGVDGRVFGDIDYNVLFDFGGSGAEDAGHIQELWLQYSGLKPFRFKVGAYPPNIGLEDQGSTNGGLFLERPADADVARGVAGGDYREAAQLTASRDRWLASVALTTRVVGTINSTGNNTAQSFDQAFGGIARVAVLPVVGDDYLVHLGAHGARVFSVSDAGGPDTPAGANRYPVQLQERPELRVDGTRLVSTGAINAKHVNVVGLEAAAQKQQFMIQGEYDHYTIERLASPLANPKFDGWYVEGGWMLTGERRKYNTGTFAFDGPTVDHPFDPTHGTWGAFELAGRYSVLDLNYHEGAFGTAPTADAVRGGKQTILSAGINWYWNPIVRFMFDYSHVDVDRLSPNAGTFLTPAGAEIGQTYNVLSVRSQLAF